MALQTQTSSEFYIKIQKLVEQTKLSYMDAVLPEKGFFELQSTTKIRLGCQLLRNYHRLKENKKHTTFNSKTGEVKYINEGEVK